MSTNVKTLFLLSSTDNSYSFSFLFHCARYWAQLGSRVLFISKTPFRCLPIAVEEVNASLNSDTFKLIQFMYLANSQELLQQLYSIHQRRNPVSVVIIKNLENYLESSKEVKSHDDHASMICSSLLYAVSICAKLTSQPTFLINDYVCEKSTVEKTIIKNFFHNVWWLQSNKSNEKTKVTLSKLSVSNKNDFIMFKFDETLDHSKLGFVEIIKQIM